MRRVRAGCVALLGASLGICACADILGIDDGTPRGDDASVLPDTSTRADSSLPPDTSVPMDSSVAPDTSPFSPLACGASTCNAVDQACCRTGFSTDAAADMFACVGADASACSLLITCDRADNCTAQGHPGDVCCAKTFGGPATSVACVATGTCNGTIVCDPGDDELCVSVPPKTCLPSATTLVGYLICR